MILALDKNNGFAHQRAGVILNAVIDQVFENDSISAFTEDLAANVFTCNAGILRFIQTQIVFQLLALLIVEIVVVDAFTQKFSRHILNPKRH